MAEARTKARILERLAAERDTLARLLSTLRPAEILVPGVVARSSVKDVLAHLADWEEHMLVWLDAARRGERVRGPGPGLTWRQLKQFNERIHEAHQDERLDVVLDYFEEAHARFMEMVESIPEGELLERGRYSFLGKQAVYDWLVSYANHDAWGTKRIREWRQTREGSGVSERPEARSPEARPPESRAPESRPPKSRAPESRAPASRAPGSRAPRDHDRRSRGAQP